MIEYKSLREAFMKMDTRQMVFYVADDINGPGFLYRTEDGRTFGALATEIKKMPELDD